MLAKLIASRHKPKSQTVLPYMSSIAFLDKAELQSVRWFGGKFGKEIVDKLQIKTVGEIHKIPINFLKNAFPSDYTRILNLANGICNEPVVQRIMPKSLSVAKILYNVDKGGKIN
jgi:DNA polymerase eta